MLSTPRSLSTLMRISSFSASPSPSAEGSVRERNRILSSESLPLLMSSRRKMSLLLYSELMMMSIKRDTSAWNSCVSAPAANCLSLWDTTGGSAKSSSCAAPVFVDKKDDMTELRSEESIERRSCGSALFRLARATSRVERPDAPPIAWTRETRASRPIASRISSRSRRRRITLRVDRAKNEGGGNFSGLSVRSPRGRVRSRATYPERRRRPRAGARGTGRGWCCASSGRSSHPRVRLCRRK